MYKKIFIILIAGFVLAQYTGTSFGAGSDSSSDSYLDLYSVAKLFVLRAMKLEEKNNIECYKTIFQGSKKITTSL